MCVSFDVVVADLRRGWVVVVVAWFLPLSQNGRGSMIFWSRADSECVIRVVVRAIL